MPETKKRKRGRPVKGTGFGIAVADETISSEGSPRAKKRRERDAAMSPLDASVERAKKADRVRKAQEIKKLRETQEYQDADPANRQAMEDATAKNLEEYRKASGQHATAKHAEELYDSMDDWMVHEGDTSEEGEDIDDEDDEGEENEELQEDEKLQEDDEGEEEEELQEGDEDEEMGGSGEEEEDEDDFSGQELESEDGDDEQGQEVDIGGEGDDEMSMDEEDDEDEEEDGEGVEEGADDGPDEEEPDEIFLAQAAAKKKETHQAMQSIVSGDWGRNVLQGDLDTAAKRFKNTQSEQDGEIMEERRQALEEYDKKEERTRELIRELNGA